MIGTVEPEAKDSSTALVCSSVTDSPLAPALDSFCYRFRAGDKDGE
jgi:hypothetical protein